MADDLHPAVAGTGVVGSLGAAMRRKGRTPVSTGDVLIALGRHHPRLRSLLALEQRHQSDAADGPDDEAVADDGGPDAQSLLREAQWNAISDRLRLQRSTLTAFDHGFTRGVAAAVRHGIDEATRQGLSHAGGLHLAVGILMAGPNNATSALAVSHVDPAAAIERIREDPDFRTPGRPWRPAVDMLRFVGAAKPPVLLPARLAGQTIAWFYHRGRTGPTLHCVNLEAMRQAVLLGHRVVTTGHLVLAVLSIDRDLADAGCHLSTGGADDGARVLRRHGVRVEDWRRSLATAAPDVPRPDGPRYHLDRAWGPTWAREAVDAVDAAARRAGGHRRVGTTAAMLGSLTDPGSLAAALLNDGGASRDAVVTELEALL